MNTNSEDKYIDVLKAEILRRREEWRNMRTCRLNKKRELMNKGLDIKEIRKEREYRGLKKEQKRLSKEIMHLEKKLNIRTAGASSR